MTVLYSKKRLIPKVKIISGQKQIKLSFSHLTQLRNCINSASIWLLISFISIIFLPGCFSFKQANLLTSTDVKYTEFSNGDKDLRFAELTMVGKPRYFGNAERLTAFSNKEGYKIFYDPFDYSNNSDSILYKLRCIRGFVPDQKGYEKLLQPLVSLGFLVFNQKLLLPVSDTSMLSAAMTAANLIEAWEHEKGIINLSKRDFRKPPYSYRKIKTLVHRANKWTIRKQSIFLANKIHEDPGKKILVLYGARHRKRVFHELHKMDKNWVKRGSFSTRSDSRYDHLLPSDTIRMYRADSNVETMSRFMNLKLSFNNNVENFAINSDDLDFDINPNTSTNAKISLHYQFLTLSYSFAPNFISGNSDDDTKGKTNTSGYALDFSFNKYFQNFSYQRTRGFYIENTRELIPEWRPGDPYILIPDLVYQNFYGVTGISTNPSFSLSSIETQTERQLRSAGTFNPQLQYRYYVLDNREEIKVGRSTQKSKNFELIAVGGYHHNFVINQSLYFYIGVEGGAGYLSSRIETRGAFEDVSNQNNLIFKWDSRAGIGYNGKKIFAGSRLRLGGIYYRQENTTTQNTESKVYYEVFAGFRISAPKFIRRRFEVF